MCSWSREILVVRGTSCPGLDARRTTFAMLSVRWFQGKRLSCGFLAVFLRFSCS